MDEFEMCIEVLHCDNYILYTKRSKKEVSIVVWQRRRESKL